MVLYWITVCSLLSKFKLSGGNEHLHFWGGRYFCTVRNFSALILNFIIIHLYIPTHNSKLNTLCFWREVSCRPHLVFRLFSSSLLKFEWCNSTVENCLGFKGTSHFICLNYFNHSVVHEQVKLFLNLCDIRRNLTFWKYFLYHKVFSFLLFHFSLQKF